MAVMTHSQLDLAVDPASDQQRQILAHPDALPTRPATVSCANGSPTSSSRIVAHDGVAEQHPIGRAALYLARFSYDVLPANRQRAIDLIRQEVEAARKEGRTARLLVPLPRGKGGAALRFEVEPASLDRL